MRENRTYGSMRRGWYPQPFTLLIPPAPSVASSRLSPVLDQAYCKVLIWNVNEGLRSRRTVGPRDNGSAQIEEQNDLNPGNRARSG